VLFVMSKPGRQNCFSVRGHYLAKYLAAQRVTYDEWERVPAGATVIVVGSQCRWREAVPALRAKHGDRIKLVLAGVGGAAFWCAGNRELDLLPLRDRFDLVCATHTWDGLAPRLFATAGVRWAYAPFGVDTELFAPEPGGSLAVRVMVQDMSAERKDQLAPEIEALRLLAAEGWKSRGWRFPVELDQQFPTQQPIEDYAALWRSVTVYLAPYWEKMPPIHANECHKWGHLRKALPMREDPVLEAAACGIPTVGIRDSIQREMIPVENEELIVEREPAAIVEAVKTAAAHPHFGIHARKFAESHSWPAVIERWWRPALMGIGAI